MKFIVALLILLNLKGFSQSGNNIVIGKKDSLYSKLLKEKREIWIHLPAGATDPLISSQRYPVLYLLDGDAHFASVTGMLQQLSEINGNTLCPEMIIVGIPNTDRYRDLTPTHTVTSYNGDSAGANSSGGGEIFTSFMEKELIPYMDSLYPTAPYRMLIGHSLGGLMVINTLIHHPGIFNAYLAIDPSMWWDRQKLLKEIPAILNHDRFNGKALFMGVANTMPPGMDTARVKEDTTGNTIHIRSILILAEDLKKAREDGLRWDYKYFNEDTHGSVPLISEYEGLRFIFGFYQFKDASQLFDTSFSVAQSVLFLTDHYKNVSKVMGYRVLPPENFVNGLGYGFLQDKKTTAKSFAFFTLNLENYPQSANVYDSMGDYYVAMNDKQKAVEYFRKALSIHDNPDTRTKLEKLASPK